MNAPRTTLAPNAPWPYHDHAAWTPRPNAGPSSEPWAQRIVGQAARRDIACAMLQPGGTYTLAQIVAATGGTASGTSKLMHRLIDKGQVIRAKTPGGVTAPYVYTWRQIA